MYSFKYVFCTALYKIPPKKPTDRTITFYLLSKYLSTTVVLSGTNASTLGLDQRDCQKAVKWLATKCKDAVSPGGVADFRY